MRATGLASLGAEIFEFRVIIGQALQILGEAPNVEIFDIYVWSVRQIFSRVSTLSLMRFRMA
jgi:hypothetical protein